MKITFASCSRSATFDSPINSLTSNCARNGQYLATVKVESDARELTGTGYGDEPNEALHKALTDACAKHTQPLHDSLRVGFEVEF